MKITWQKFANFIRKSDTKGKAQNVTAAAFKNAAGKEGETVTVTLTGKDANGDDYEAEAEITNIEAINGGYKGLCNGVEMTFTWVGNRYEFTASQADNFNALNPLPTLRALLKEGQVTGTLDNTNYDEWKEASTDNGAVNSIELIVDGASYEDRTYSNVTKGTAERSFTATDNQNGSTIEVVFDEKENATFTLTAPATFATNLEEEAGESPVTGNVVLDNDVDQQEFEQSVQYGGSLTVELQKADGTPYGTRDLESITKGETTGRYYATSTDDEGNYPLNVVVTFDAEGKTATFTATAYVEQPLNEALKNGPVAGSINSDTDVSTIKSAAAEENEADRTAEIDMNDLYGYWMGNRKVTNIANNNGVYSGRDEETGATVLFDLDNSTFVATMNPADNAGVTEPANQEAAEA